MRLQALELAALFVAVLNVPVLSTGAAYAIFAWRLILWMPARAAHPRLWARLGVLFMFVASYYVTSLSHGFIDVKTAIRYSVVIVGFYATGYAAGGGADERGPLRASLAVVGGLVIFTWLSVSQGGLRFDEIDRAAPSFWNAAEIVNGPGLGGMASLGLCLAPVTLLAAFASELPRRERWGVGLVAAALVAAGGYSNLALKNRTPVLALVASLAVAAFLALRTRRGAGRIAAVLGIALVGAALYAAVRTDLIASSGLALRFMESGLETERYDAWRRMFGGMLAYPFGGRGVSLPGLRYAHNLWLDVAYETGLVPLVLLALFHLGHVGSVWRFFRRETATLLALLLACIAVSFVMTFLVEPALQASAPYFATSGFFLGLLLRREEVPAGEVEAEPLRPEPLCADAGAPLEGG